MDERQVVMLEVKFYDTVEDSLLKFAVIVSQSNGKWVFCKHKERDTYEVPGGHREAGEDILETAKRELMEETGAIRFDIQPICVYSVTGKTCVNDTGEESYGLLCVAEIFEFSGKLDSEMEKIIITKELPKNWTYPLIQPKLLEKCVEWERMMKLEYKKATIEDLEELVRTRIIVLRAANKLSVDVDMSAVERESYAYYKRALESGEHIAYLVYDEDTFVGAGGVSFYQVMPTYHNASGRKAYIMNMYTSPEYRRRGIAYHMLDLLVKAAKERGISQISLEATQAGRPLYEKYGFVKMDDEMELVKY